MTWPTRLVAFLVAMVVVSLAPPSAAVATAPSSAPVLHVYVVTPQGETSTTPNCERGPSIAYDEATVSAFVEYCLRAVLSHDGEAGVAHYATYDVPSNFVQEAHATATTSQPAQVDSGDLSPFQPGLVAANGADNVVNGTRLGQQLARESADSAFTSSGRLSSGAIADSRQIIPGSRLGNKDLIQRLTSGGSDIADWGKYTTRTHQSPSGDFQVHFYMNRSTGAIDYGYDYKVIFNGAR